MELVVVGGGALGCSAALALAEDGHDVRLVEQSQPGAGATHKAAGICSTMTWDDRELQLIAETRGMVGELISLAMCEGAMHARDAWRPVDSILLGKLDDPRLKAVMAVLERNGEEPEWFEGRAAQRECPDLIVAPDEALLLAQEDGVLDAGALMEALTTRMQGEGVELVTGKAWDGPGDEDGLVIAGGAWTRSLVEKTWNVTLPIKSFRTQLATLEMPGDIPIVHDLHHGFYARPESENSVLAGDGTRLSDHDPASYNEAAGPAFQQSIAAAVTKRFEYGADAKWRTGWAGLCVGTPDRHPMCGAIPGVDDAWVLTGDNGFGLMRSLALGARVAEAVEGRPAEWLSPGRFGDLGLDFEMREGFGDLES